MALNGSWMDEIRSVRRFLSLPIQSRQVVFYAEGAKDFPTWSGLIQTLFKRSDFEIAYWTSDLRDPMLLHPLPRLNVFYIRRLLPWMILGLEAKVLVMTLPELHRHHLRRSLRGAHHLYVFHALCSTHMIYRLGAFDHYDTIFCVGPHQVQELRAAEALYRLPAKQLVEVGYFRLDRQMQRRSCVQASTLTPKVLIAPSWGDANILESCAQPLVESLLRGGFEVVVRPHPEFVKRRPAEIAQLRGRLTGQRGLTWEMDPLEERTFYEAEVLVTDWSGIALEYAFATERPVLFVDVPPKVHNPRYRELEILPIEVRLREVIGRVIPLDQIGSAAEEAHRLIQDRPAYQSRIREARREAVFHLGHSSEKGAEFLLDLLAGV